MTKSEDSDIKVILVGEMSTGKTSLINITIGGKFIGGKELTTSTASFVTKQMTIGDKTYTLNLWDTIGQEKFRSLTKIFIKDSKIVIFVYDITNMKSFTELDYWFKTIKEVWGDEAILGIAGNKQDLYVKEQVNEELVKKYAEEKKVPYKLTSAKNPLSFISFLEDLLKTYIVKNGGIIESSGGKKLKGGNNPDEKKKGCC